MSSWLGVVRFDSPYCKLKPYPFIFLPQAWKVEMQKNLSMVFKGAMSSAVGRESRDGKFPGIPGFLAFPFPGNSGPGSREKEPHELGLFQANFEGKKEFSMGTYFL